MGQAKLRGSLEQRQAEGKARREERASEAKRRADARWSAMTPEQRKRAIELQTLVAIALAFTTDAGVTP